MIDGCLASRLVCTIGEKARQIQSPHVHLHPELSSDAKQRWKSYGECTVLVHFCARAGELKLGHYENYHLASTFNSAAYRVCIRVSHCASRAVAKRPFLKPPSYAMSPFLLYGSKPTLAHREL